MTDGDSFCMTCGAKSEPAASPRRDGVKPYSKCASWAWILGFFSVYVVPAPAAAALGIAGLVDLRRHPEKRGRGRAWFGIAMGVAVTVLTALIAAKESSRGPQAARSEKTRIEFAELGHSSEETEIDRAKDSEKKEQTKAGKLEVSVSSSAIALGDSFTISVSFSGEEVPDEVPVVSNPGAASIVGPRMEKLHWFVRGRASDRSTWHWTAVPEGTGVVAFGTAMLRVGDQTFSAPVPEVRVGSHIPQPYARVSLSAEKSEMQVGETFAVSVDVDLLALMSSDSVPFDATPLVPGEPLHLHAPHFSDNANLGPCELSEAPATALSRLRSETTTGFTVKVSPNPFSGMGFPGFPSMPSLFDSDPPAVFSPPPIPFVENGTNYVRHSFVLSFRATAEGVCRFHAPILKGCILVRNGDHLVRSPGFTVLGKTLEVRVIAPLNDSQP